MISADKIMHIVQILLLLNRKFHLKSTISGNVSQTRIVLVLFRKNPEYIDLPFLRAVYWAGLCSYQTKRLKKNAPSAPVLPLRGRLAGVRTLHQEKSKLAFLYNARRAIR
jgi:hypothetical protein